MRGRETGASSQDTFGWWLAEEDTSKSFDESSTSSSSSMVSCIDSESAEDYVLADDFRENSTNPSQDLSVELIEADAAKDTGRSSPAALAEPRVEIHSLSCRSTERRESRCSQGVCYTPERLVRCQDYRILTPSPRYITVSQARITPEHESPRKARRCRRRLNCLIDTKQVGATQLKALLDPNASEILAASDPSHWRSYQRVRNNEDESKTKESLSTSDLGRSASLFTPDSISKRSSCERLNITWDEPKKLTTRSSSSLEDTSGVQSNWSSDTHSDLQNSAPRCLCDELADTGFNLNVSRDGIPALQEVVSLFGLFEEDRFCRSTSSHDRLTRLALAIETDTQQVPLGPNSCSSVQQLHRKVKQLQIGNKDIHKDVYNLRKGFQWEEEKMSEISSSARQFREDLQETRYLDDLLQLLQGELETISRRNWPFLLGHGEQPEEINLIV